MDSFPVAVCDNIRINRSKVLKGEQYRGKHVAMHRYFYGVRVQVLTLYGVPVEFCLVPGRENDSKALGKLPFDVPPESCIYMDAGYTDYLSEDDLFEAALIHAMVQRKKNSKRKDEPHVQFLKQHMRKEIETTFSELKARMLRTIHAVTQQGFLLKVALFVIAFSFEKIAWLATWVNLTLVTEGMRSKQLNRLSRYNTTTNTLEKLYDLNQTDAYNDPGDPVTKRNNFGRLVIVVDGDSKILMNDPVGSSAKGDLQFLAKYNWASKKNEIIWHCAEGSYEYVADVLDPQNLVVVTRRESQNLVSNYYLKTLSGSTTEKALTAFANPYSQLKV